MGSGGVRSVVAAVTLLMMSAAALADTVYLDDGSQLNGTVQWMSADTLSLETGFAGTLSLAREQIVGVDTQAAVPVELDSGERAQARLAYDTGAGTQGVLIGGRDRTARADEPRLGSIALIAPGAVATQQSDNTDDSEYELPESDLAPPEDEDYWSGRFEVAINGNSGNTDNRTILTSLSALRDTGPTRLDLSASVDKEEEDGEETADEYLGKARYENDFTNRAFWFLQQELEKDEFENIDLRSRTLVGPGYFLLRQDRLTFKVRSGIGYQYESYTDSGGQGEMIASAGWDYAQLVGEWLELTHEFTIYPEITNSPSDNYLLESALGAEVPIADSRVWSIRGELDHEYNSNPEPGVEDLDTSYRIGVVRDF